MAAGRDRLSSQLVLTFTAQPHHIDVMGHVNNAVWLQWMEAAATAHWEADAAPEHRELYAWLVVRHEIDYRGNIHEGQQVEARTFLADGPHGARFVRHCEFRPLGADGQPGKIIVSALTTWVMIERASGKLMRVPPEVAAPFLPDQPSSEDTGT